ncbi:hypothetical protein NQZ68_036968 [Dissostichus eleginoides]|nr:hypothetical protein NQZ68_036968 [Dissostichus eleginoides]
MTAKYISKPLSHIFNKSLEQGVFPEIWKEAKVRLLYCSLEEAELIFRAALAAGQAGPSHMWFAVGPALSGLGLEGLPKALFAIRPQGWRDEPRR